MLEGISLRDCFEIIVAAQDVTVGKPDPQGYLKCMKLVAAHAKISLEPKDCLVIEDAPSVIKSVKGAGFPTLGVATSHTIEKLSDADWRVGTLEPAAVREQIPKLKLVV